MELSSFKSVSNNTKQINNPEKNETNRKKRKAIKEINKNHIHCRGRIRYENNKYQVYIIHGINIHKTFDLDTSLLDFSNCDRCYSLPDNDNYEPWTEKRRIPHLIKEEQRDMILSAWGRFRLNDIIYGYIDLTTNTFFGDVRKTQRLSSDNQKVI